MEWSRSTGTRAAAAAQRARLGEKEKGGSTWDLTEEGARVLAEGGRHGGVQAGLAVPGGQLRARVVATLVVVVLDVEVDQLGEVDAERAARVVDVLAVQSLRGGRTEVSPARSPREPRGRSLTSLACWALTGSLNCRRAWNWLFLVKVMIFMTVPNLEKIWKGPKQT